MNINTRPFGEMEINEDDIMEFPYGILAFEDNKKYVILAEEEDSLFNWLQNIEDPNLAFLVVDPRVLIADYQPEVLASDIENVMGQPDTSSMAVYCILTVPHNHPDKMTINLQGPVLIDLDKKIGGQFISNDDSHHVRAPVMELIEARETAGC